MSDSTNVLNCDSQRQNELISLLKPYGIDIKIVIDTADIPGSFFGDREAGLIGNTLFVRNDTPVHSALHESCHYICMDQQRRSALNKNAEGDYDEENAVCYLQILLADQLTSIDSERMMIDMDRWGYSFRFGSAKDWFEHDADDACAWLKHHGIINDELKPTWRLRQ